MSLKPKEPVKKEIRNKVLPPCRVSEEELNLFKTKATSAGLSLSDFQRQALTDSIIIKKNHILDIKTVLQLSDIGSRFKYLASISNNLNQLTRTAHIHDEVDKERLQKIISDIESMNLKTMKGQLERIVKELIDGS